MKPRFARISSAPALLAALAVLVAGACGSAATPSASTSTSAPKLSLAKAGARTGAADASLAPGAMPIRPATNYVLDGTLPDLGTRAPVYRWTAHAVDIAAVNRLAAALGIDAPATATADGFSATDSDATLTVTTNSGATQISYYPGGSAVDGSSGSSSGGSSVSSDGSTGASSPPSGGVGVAPAEPGVTELPQKLTPPVDVPNATDAEHIARELLDRMGVLAGQEWDTQVTDSGGIAISCAVGEVCSGTPQSVTARDVVFTLVIDGVRVNGIGWNVTVGEHSRIDSLYGEWGTADVLGTYKLRSTADAFAALQQGDTNFGGGPPLAIDNEVPVRAQGEPTGPAVDLPTNDVAPPVSEPNGSEPAGGPTPVDSLPPDTMPAQPIDVHVTGVSLGFARWDAVDGDQNVVDIVPAYEFHTVLDGTTSDVEELALDPAAIDFANPVIPPVPVPEPGVTKPEPAPAPDASGSGSSSETPKPTTTG
jgi:hypothetical protein